MNNIAKILIGVGVVGATVAATTFVATKIAEKNTITIKAVDEDDNSVVDEIKEETLLNKFKEAAKKKVIKILAWVALHQQQIESVGTLIGLAGGLFSIVNSIKEYNYGKELHEKLDYLVNAEESFREAWNSACDVEMADTKTIMDKLNAMHLDMSMLHELHEELLAPKKITRIKTA